MCVCMKERERKREIQSREVYLLIILKHLMITSRIFYYRWNNISSTKQRLNPGFRGGTEKLKKKEKEKVLIFPECPEFSTL